MSTLHKHSILPHIFTYVWKETGEKIHILARCYQHAEKNKNVPRDSFFPWCGSFIIIIALVLISAGDENKGGWEDFLLGYGGGGRGGGVNETETEVNSSQQCNAKSSGFSRRRFVTCALLSWQRLCGGMCRMCGSCCHLSVRSSSPLGAHHSGEECSRILYGFIFQALEATPHLSGWVWRQNLLRRGFRPGWGTARMMGRREGPPSPRGRLLQWGKRKELPVWPLQMWNQQQIGQSFIKRRKSNVCGEVA